MSDSVRIATQQLLELQRYATPIAPQEPLELQGYTIAQEFLQLCSPCGNKATGRKGMAGSLLML